MKQTFVMDFDDLEAGAPGLDLLMKMKEHYPNFKCTCFTVPIPKKALNKKFDDKKLLEWADLVRELDWLEIAPHGNSHQFDEMKYFIGDKGKKHPLGKDEANLMIDVAEQTFSKFYKLPYVKIWKSPFWETADVAYEALRDRGYVVATDSNVPAPLILGMKQYRFNWTIDQKIPQNEEVLGHGHMFGKIANSIDKCLPNLLTMPTDAKFKTIGEHLKLEKICP